MTRVVQPAVRCDVARRCPAVVWLAAAWLLVVGTALAADPEPLSFVRVYVPPDRLADVPLGEGRYVPMTLAEFRTALAGGRSVMAAARGSPERAVIADTAEYRLEWTPTNGLEGTAEVLLGPDLEGLRRAIPLGGVAIEQATFSSDAGTGAAEVCGLPDGSMAVMAEAAGRYGWKFRLATDLGGRLGPSFRLPLVPAVFTSLVLRLPDGFVPIVRGAAPVRLDEAVPSQSVGSGATGVRWRVDLGPSREVVGTIAREPLPEVPLAVWNHVAIARRAASISSSVVPMTSWTGSSVQVQVDPGVAVVAARLITPQGATAVAWDRVDRGDTDTGGGGTTIVMRLPTQSVGTRGRLVIDAVASFESGRPLPLPQLRPPDSLWAGGGVVATVDPLLAVERVAEEGCLPVDESVVAAWPLARNEATTQPAASSGVVAEVAFEWQSPGASVALTVAPRRPRFEVTRVTTVDISAGSVMAQVACTASVSRGEIFELTGRVPAGWLIDSVEIASRGERPDWRVEPTADGSLLRIGLLNAVPAGGSVRINVMGHRSPLRQGEPFRMAALEMLRFEGERPGSAALEIRTNAEMTIDGAGKPVESVPLEGLSPALRSLAGDTGVRLRLLAGEAAGERLLRLLRRRPPIDVQTQVRLTVRDDRLTESFTLECSPRDAELDSVVVHLSEPTGDLMEWTLLSPTPGRLLARRLPSQEPRDPVQGMESWLLEIVPPVRGAVTMRGVQTVPFTGPVNVPLAWVEGAASPVGELHVRDAGRRRPMILNRSLSEMPGAVGEGDRMATSVSRFLFDPVRDIGSGPAAARLVPGEDEGVAPRAWAWNETTTCWCHTSGEVEYETVFEIENHGRVELLLSHPPDKRVQEIRVDGVQLSAGVRQTLSGETVIELPAGRRMIRLEIRSLAAARPLLAGWDAAWSIDPTAGMIDVPVLERLWRVGLPPELRLAHVPSLHRRLEQPQAGWSERLFAATTRMKPLLSDGTTTGPTAALVDGFRVYRLAPTSGRSLSAPILLISSRVAIAAAIVLTAVSALLTWMLARRSPAAAIAVAGLAAMAALWVPTGLVGITRGGLWGSLAGMLVVAAGRHTRTSRLAVLLIAACWPVPAVAEGASTQPEEPLRVIVGGDSDDATVLVPDRLFRQLGRGVDAVAGLGVRMERVTVVASVPDADQGGTGGQPGEPWRMNVDFNSDSNTVCTLRQPLDGGRFLADSLELDGGAPEVTASVSISDDGRVLRVPIAVPGRHRLTVLVQPSRGTLGRLGTAAIAIPVAPQARVRVRDRTAPLQPGSVLVDASRRGRPWATQGGMLQEPAGGLYDVGRADMIQLSWPLDPGVALVREPRVLATRNDCFWDASGCRLVATFQIDPSDGIVPSITVAADPRLTPAIDAIPPGSEPIEVRRSDGSNWQVKRLRPTRGRATLAVPFSMPLVDPVGVERVPEVWMVVGDRLEATGVVQFMPAPGYAATVRLPVSVTAASLSDPAAPPGWLAWRREPPLASATDTGGLQPAVVTVTRRPATLRGTQRMRLDTVDQRVRLRFDASLDSVETALTGLQLRLPVDWSIDRLGLAHVTAPRDDALEARAMDIHWHRGSDDLIDIVCQRPTSGRFRLDLQARGPVTTAASGDLTVPGIVGLQDTPVVIEWPTEGGLEPVPPDDGVAPAEVSSAWQSIEQFAGTSLAFKLRQMEPAAAVTSRPSASPPIAGPASRDSASTSLEASAQDLGDGQAGPRVELTEVQFASDERGKAWGVARFDLVPAGPLVRMQLPSGMRLFEVFVDEHPLRARPVGEDAWELELLDVTRPRTIQVIFAGDLGDRLVSGRPLKLEPPRLIGIPIRNVIWTIRGPRELELRLLPPAAAITRSEADERRTQAMARLQTTLRQSLAGKHPQEQQRIAEQVGSLLVRTQPNAAEQAWIRTSLDLSAEVLATTSAPDGDIVVRAAPRPTPMDASRPLATAAVILIVGTAWSLAIRTPRKAATTAARLWPLAAFAVGLGWLLVLTPAWPGVAALVTSTVAVLRRLVEQRRQAARETAFVIRDSAA